MTFGSAQALTAEELENMDAYWRACTYLCVGMIYLHDNPLLKQPLRPERIKNRLLGHCAPIPARPLHGVMEILSEHTLEGYLLPVAMGASTARRPSSTSSIRCTTSTRSGLNNRSSN